MKRELSDKQKSFFELMRRSIEHSAQGIKALLERDDFASFFENVADVGIFEASTVPRPEAATDGQGVRLRHWPPVDYLMACAKWAREHADDNLASGIMRVIRNVTDAADDDEALRDNYHVWRNFAEIIGVFPLTVLERTDEKLVRIWLRSRYDRIGVVNELDKGVLGPLLESGDAELIEAAVAIMADCLQFEWKQEGSGKYVTEAAVPLVDAYWLQQLMDHQSARLGEFAREAGATLLRNKVLELFAKDIRTRWSYLFRPAIEEHAQNHEWKSVENAILSGFRDVLASWVAVAPRDALSFVRDLLRSDSQILRRVGVYILNVRWENLRELYLELVSPSLFDSSHTHELYGLLKARFAEFSVEEKKATIDAIDELPIPNTDKPEDDLAHTKLRWLSAIRDSDYEPARERLSQFLAQGRRAIPDHADFLTYTTVGWARGTSPYEPKELLAFAEDGSLVQRLNDFREEDRWHGPSIDGLADALDQAIANAPDIFVRILPTFKHALPRFQSRLVAAFKRLWESQTTPAGSEWQSRWDKLFAFIELLLRENPFGGDELGENSSQWVISSIADLLQAGTRDDERAYAPELLPRGWPVIQELLDRARAVDKPSNDPMTQAINSPRGRLLDAAFLHALRASRVQDKSVGAHDEAWATVEPLFSRELESAQGGNFEFSTLAGSYFPNLLYLSSGWTKAHCSQIFSKLHQENFVCALDGLAYAQANRGVYEILRDAGVLERALHLRDMPETARKHLNERIALGYLWGDDSLDSDRMSYWFRAEGGEDIASASWLLWTARGQDLSKEQTARVRAFLDRAIRWAHDSKTASKEFLSRLSLLSWSLPDARGRNQEMLIALAPSVAVGHSIHEFVGELNRLVEASAAEVSVVLGRLLDTAEPYYDYDDELKKLVENLARFGQPQAALRYANKMRGIPGMPQLFDRLKGTEFRT